MTKPARHNMPRNRDIMPHTDAETWAKCLEATDAYIRCWGDISDVQTGGRSDPQQTVVM